MSNHECVKRVFLQIYNEVKDKWQKGALLSPSRRDHKTRGQYITKDKRLVWSTAGQLQIIYRHHVDCRMTQRDLGDELYSLANTTRRFFAVGLMLIFPFYCVFAGCVTSVIRATPSHRLCKSVRRKMQKKWWFMNDKNQGECDVMQTLLIRAIFIVAWPVIICMSLPICVHRIRKLTVLFPFAQQRLAMLWFYFFADFHIAIYMSF